MNYKLKLPVDVDPDSIKDITYNFKIDLYLLKTEENHCQCKQSRLRIEAIQNLKSGNLYFYKANCKVGKKNVEYKYQTGDNIETDYSLYYLN